MAGAGYKLFASGDVLTAAQVNTYLNEQTVMVFATSAARTSALSAVLAEGMMSYLQDSNTVFYYDGAAWNALASGDLTAITAGTGISVTSGTGPIPTVAIDTSVTVDKTTAQTLTNKTLTSPALTTPTISTLTTNGDLLYGTGSGAIARLGIGSTGQVVTVASGLPSWSTPTSGGMTLISTTTMNAGNFTLSSIAGTYKHLKLVLVDVYLNTSAEFFWIRCNGDTGSNYQRRQYTLNATTLSGSTTIQTNHLISQAGSSNTNITNGFANIDLYNYTATSGGQLIVSQASGYDSANLYGTLNTGVYNKSAAITSITVGANNSFAGGTCLFYGVS